MQNRSLLIGVGILALVAVVGYFAFAGRAPQTEPEPSVPSVDTTIDTITPATQEGDTTQPEMAEDDDVLEVAVDGDEYSFDPASITVTEGETVRVAFTNAGSFPHNFIIDELGVATETISPGGTDTVEFTADQSGTFTFYCSVGNHRQLGMEGELDVE